MTAPDTDALLAAIPLPLVVIGADERVRALNPPARQIFGAAAEGAPYVAFLRRPVLLDCVGTALRTRQPQEAELAARDGERDVTYRAVAAPHAGGVVLSLFDVSHVQAATEMRRDFVANVSHELRTPLTALIGFIETLRGPARDDSEAAGRFLAIMAREADRMSRLIDDLLSLSRVESLQRVRPTGHADLAALVAAAAATLGPLAQEAGIEIVIDREGQDFGVTGDADQLLQVLANLLENAIKYGRSRARVTLSAIDRDATLRCAAVRIEVQDDGPGIPPHLIPRVTERFYRVDTHRSREKGGTGLGLAIVKHIVGRHRGRLVIDSPPGQGARVSVVLPR